MLISGGTVLLYSASFDQSCCPLPGINLTSCSDKGLFLSRRTTMSTCAARRIWVVWRKWAENGPPWTGSAETGLFVWDISLPSASNSFLLVSEKTEWTMPPFLLFISNELETQTCLAVSTRRLGQQFLNNIKKHLGHYGTATEHKDKEKRRKKKGLDAILLLFHSLFPNGPQKKKPINANCSWKYELLARNGSVSFTHLSFFSYVFRKPLLQPF